jgi:hypothetical protein
VHLQLAADQVTVTIAADGTAAAAAPEQKQKKKEEVTTQKMRVPSGIRTRASFRSNSSADSA